MNRAEETNAGQPLPRTVRSRIWSAALALALIGATAGIVITSDAPTHAKSSASTGGAAVSVPGMTGAAVLTAAQASGVPAAGVYSTVAAAVLPSRRGSQSTFA